MTVEIHALLISNCTSGIVLIIVDVILKSVNKSSSSHIIVMLNTITTISKQE